jgi:hypothetical protein
LLVGVFERKTFKNKLFAFLRPISFAREIRSAQISLGHPPSVFRHQSFAIGAQRQTPGFFTEFCGWAVKDMEKGRDGNL